MELTDGKASLEHVRAVLMVLVNAWNKKMQLPELARGMAKPPVITAEVASQLAGDMATLTYMRPITDEKTGAITYAEVAPSDDDKDKKYQYDTIHERMDDPAFTKNLASVLNRAMIDEKVRDNFVGSMHGSLLAMLKNDQTKSTKSNTNVGILSTNTGALHDGERCWFTLAAVTDKLAMKGQKLDALEGHLCTYQLFSRKDVYGGITGKVIVCSQEAAGVKDIPARVAEMINSALREKYNVDHDIAHVVNLSDVTFNVEAGTDPNTGRRKIVKHTGMTVRGMSVGVEIDCSERIQVGKDLLDPREVVSKLFKDDELPITRFSKLMFKSEGPADTGAEDPDTEAENENRVLGELTAGHERGQDLVSNEHRIAQVKLLGAHLIKLPNYIATLNSVAKLLDAESASKDTAWKVVPYNQPDTSDDIYKTLASAVSSVSDYIINATSGVFSEENAPFAIDKLFAHENVRFASNVVPKKDKGSISLDNYVSVMKQIITKCIKDAPSASYKTLISSAGTACNNLVSFETGVYELLSPGLHDYNEVDVKEVSEKRESSKLADQYRNAKIDVRTMDKYIGVDLSGLYADMGSPLPKTMSLDDYLGRAYGYFDQTGDTEDALVDTPKSLDAINDALKTLIGVSAGNESSNATGVLNSVLKAVSPKAETPKPVETQVPPAQNEPKPKPTETPTPTPKPDEEPKPTKPEQPQPQSTSTTTAEPPKEEKPAARVRKRTISFDEV